MGCYCVESKRKKKEVIIPKENEVNRETYFIEDEMNDHFLDNNNNNGHIQQNNNLKNNNNDINSNKVNYKPEQGNLTNNNSTLNNLVYNNNENKTNNKHKQLYKIQDTNKEANKNIINNHFEINFNHDEHSKHKTNFDISNACLENNNFNKEIKVNQNKNENRYNYINEKINNINYKINENKRKKEEEIIEKRRKLAEEKETKRKEEEQIERKIRIEKEKRKREEEENERKRREKEEMERKKREEGTRKKRKEDINISQRGRINILNIIDKEKLKKIVSSCPKRTSISLNKFREYLKKVTNNLKDEEKAYVLFYWITQNIKYDAESYFSGVYKTAPEETYNTGNSVCSGYSRLFEYIGSYLGLEIINVSGYAKGYSYKINEKISGTNHEWNIIKLNNVYYQIDSTWGAGCLSGREFKKEFKEFYFCPKPEYLISSHYPEEKKWQLIYPYISIEEFSKRVKFSTKFYEFFTTNLLYHTMKVKSKHIIRFNKINEKANIESLINIYDQQGNITNNALGLVLYNKKYIDFFYIFKKKGKYKTNIYTDYKNIKSKSHVVTYYLDCQEDWKDSPDTPFSLPKIYNNDITIIEPIFNIMKKGKNVTLKLKSDVTEEIIITNGNWLYIKKNKDGIFEITLTVNTDEIFIGRKTNKEDFLTSITYKVT